MKQSLLAGILFCYLSSLAYAADDAIEPKEPTQKKNEISEILDSMGYPELQVVPHASERLAIEAKAEDSAAVIAHWPIQVSGLATLIVGIAAKGNSRTDLTPKEISDTATIASVTTAVGLGWVVGAAVLGGQRTYRSGLNSVNKYPGKDDRSALLRERLSEEALEKPARTMRVLTNVSVITNVAVNIGSAWHANETGKMMAGVGAVLAFFPLVFEDHSIEVYEKQLEYKKKIYTPLKSASFSYDTKSKSFAPMTYLTWMF